jgi:hypothetical protein
MNGQGAAAVVLFFQKGAPMSAEALRVMATLKILF